MTNLKDYLVYTEWDYPLPGHPHSHYRAPLPADIFDDNPRQGHQFTLFKVTGQEGPDTELIA